MSSNLSRVILGSLVIAPNFLEIAELNERLFLNDRERRAFKIISDFWENGRPAEIDSILLADRLGGNGAVTFVSELITGLQRFSPEIFAERVRELKRQVIGGRLVSDLKKEMDLVLKTGLVPDLSRIRAGFEELDQIQSAKEGANAKPLEAFEPEAISWLWPSRIPKAMLTLLAGSPGAGKSFLSIAIAARLSRGETLPDAGGLALSCNSLFLAAEDPVAQAIRPRADANGADPSKIFILEVEDFAPENGIKKLRAALNQNKEIGLVVVDPLNAFLTSGADYFRDPDVRRTLLQPLIRIAEESKIAILAVVHFNKRDDPEVLNRIGGSIAYGAAARSIIGLGIDPEDGERRLIVPIKTNYTRPPAALAFRIGPDLRITFEDAPILNLEAEDIFLKQRKDEIVIKSFAAEWLSDILKDGPVEFKEILATAKKAGIAQATLYRAKAHLKVRSVTHGFGQFKSTSWEAPK